MKKRTRLASALMYALVAVVCIGVLCVLERMTNPKPSTPTEVEESISDGNAGATGADSGAGDGEENGFGEAAEEGEKLTEEPLKREEGYHSWKKEFPGMWNPPPKEEPYMFPKIVLATDLHYQSRKADDEGEAFKLFVERCDGKVVPYLPELLEAWMDQMIETKPSAVVLSGDITMNGEKLNHEELSQRLKRLTDAGIPLLVIPGNHDINNPHASVYFGKEAESTPSITGEEFYGFYHAYGYDQAVSRDSASLSYVYQLDKYNRILMLDSCQYDPQNRVEGKIKEETLAWIEEQLKQAKEDGVFILPIAHHNLLSQSRMYTTQCTIENSDEVVALFKEYEIPLFCSGHLHVQRIRRYKDEPGMPDDAWGIREIVTDALSIPPCQYGELEWKEDGSLSYSTRSVDVSAWAKKTGNENPDLLNFEEWSETYLEKLITAQIRGVIKNLGEEIEHSMASMYAAVYMDYYAGREIDEKGVKTSIGYRWWERNLPDSYLIRELNAMIADSDRDNNYLLLPEAFSVATPSQVRKATD